MKYRVIMIIEVNAKNVLAAEAVTSDYIQTAKDIDDLKVVTTEFSVIPMEPLP